MISWPMSSPTRFKQQAALALVILITGVAACSSKRKSSQVTVRGALSVPASVQKGTLMIGASKESFASLINNPLASTTKLVTTTDLTKYELTLDQSDLTGAKQLQIFALLSKNFSPTNIPTLAADDLIGFYVNNLRPGLSLTDPSAHDLYADLQVNRAFSGRTISLPIQLVDPATNTFQVGVYCGEINGTSPKQLDINNIVYLATVAKNAPAFSTTLTFQLFQASPSNECYVFAFNDQNTNLGLDVGEYYGFYSDRSDLLPTPVNIGAPIETPLKITMTGQMRQPSAQPILLKGKLNIAADMKTSMKRFFAIAVKQDRMAFSAQSVSKNVLSFQRVDADHPSFEIDLSNAPVDINDKVTVLALADAKDFGLPSLDDGDGLGLAIQNNTFITKAVQYGVNDGFNVDLQSRYYSGKATIQAQMKSAYKGPVILYAYRGSLPLDVTAVDASAVVGYAVFNKSGDSAEAQIDVFGLGQNWPITVSIIAVQDANSNQKLDPGEVLQLAVNASGIPQTVTLKSGDQVDWPLTYLYTTQIPSAQNMTLKGSLRLGANVNSPFVRVLVAQAPNIDAITADPLKYVKATQLVPTAVGQYTLPLVNTSLKPGDQVYVLAIAADGSSDFPVLNDSAVVGIYGQGTAVTYTLHNGLNEHADIVVDKTPYQNKINIIGQLTDSYQGSVTAVLFKGSPLDLANQKMKADDFIAMQTVQKSDQTANFTFTQVLSNKSLPLAVIPLAFEDANGNGQPDPGEVVYYANDPQTNNPLSLQLTTSLTTSFTFDHALTLATPGTSPLQVSGALAFNTTLDDKSRLYVMVLDANIPSLAPDQMTTHLYAVQSVPRSATSYTIDLTATAARAGNRVIVVGLIDRSGGAFPQLSHNDLIGFYSGRGALALTLAPGMNSGVDVTVNQPIYDGQAVVSGTLSGINADHLVMAAYGGDLDSITDFSVDPHKVLGLLQIDKPNNSFFELTVNSFGEPFPLSCYIFAFGDANHNQQLDPGETVYYYSSRADKVPEKILLQQGQRISLSLNHTLPIQTPSGNNISLSGALTWDANDQTTGAAAYLFVARGQNIATLMADPMGSIRFLQKLDGRPSSYDVSLVPTELNPGDKVIVGAWIDYDGNLAPSAGDKVGVYLNGMTSYVTLTAGANAGVPIKISRTLYNTQKTLNATFSGSTYSGHVVALVYAGALTGLDLASFDVNAIAGFSDFTKAANTPDLQIPLLPTSALPLSGATTLALLDSNDNGQADPGELIVFASAKAGSMPLSQAIDQNFGSTITLNSYYRIPVPSGEQMSAKGVVAANFADASNYPTALALLSAGPFAQVLAQPVSYLKAFTVLPPGVSNYAVDLSKSDLHGGDQVMVVAFQNPVSDSTQQLQLVEGARLGLLLNASTYATAFPLSTGVNDLNTQGFSLNMNRLYYNHNGTAQVNVASSGLQNGDSIVLAAYQINTTNQTASTIAAQLSTVDPAKVAAYSRTTYSGDGVYTVPLLPAFPPGFVEASTRTITNLAVVGFQDTSGHGALSSGQTPSVYTESYPIPTLVSLGLVTNTLKGKLTITPSAATSNGGGAGASLSPLGGVVPAN